jgi:hypothetical protein
VKTNPLAALAPYWKAVVGFVAPGAVVLAASVLPGSDGGEAITTAELVTAGTAMLITAAGVYRADNVTEAGHDDRGQEEPLTPTPVDDPFEDLA